VALRRKGRPVRVLVIEDDEEMAETVAVGLRRARMAVDVALDGPAGLERAPRPGGGLVVEVTFPRSDPREVGTFPGLPGNLRARIAAATVKNPSPVHAPGGREER
jgi:hypothetical protein